jgi:2-polyprenyl-3-methyl-5-hydroxy-6-metoxy-1,4-benzoquinol methylase
LALQRIARQLGNASSRAVTVASTFLELSQEAEMDSSRYSVDLAAAWVRGVRPDLAGEDDAATCAAAISAGLRIHRFKHLSHLPRVRRVLGILQAFAPSSLLDVGTGRGAFLWPLLDELPSVPVTCIDLLEHRVDDIEAVRRGGIERVRAVKGDVCEIELGARFDVVTALEVLEHVDDPIRAAKNLLRHADRAIIVTVPSKPDDNPEHLRLFDKRGIEALFHSAGAAKVEVSGVLDHLVAVVQP